MSKNSDNSVFLGLLDGLVTLFKYTLVLLLFWFIIGAGCSGWYEMYCRKVKDTIPDDSTSEIIGNIGFLIYCLSIVLVLIVVGNSDTDIGVSAIYTFLGWSFYYLLFCFVGLVYFFKHVKTD